jgi:6-phosphogluconolactonase
MKRDRLCIILEKDREALSERGANLFESEAIEAVEKEGHFFVALSGGSTPRNMHRRLASLSSMPWQEIDVFWGDERCVPAHDPSSNYGVAWADFLHKIPLPAEHIHPMPAHMDSEQGALRYEGELYRVFNLQQGQVPVFDMVFLGLGKDGHTASLFPGSEFLKEEERLVVTVKGGDPNVNRLTLTLPVINNAREVVFMVSGREKAEMVKAVIEKEDGRLPASRVRPTSGSLTWLLDQEAASSLAEETLSFCRAVTGGPS